MKYFDEALEIAKKYNMKDRVPRILVNKGLGLHYQGKLKLARNILEEAIEKCQEINLQVYEEYARRYLGFLLLEEGKLSIAKREFQKAQTIAKKIKTKVGLASAKIGLGLIKLIIEDDRILIDEGLKMASEANSVEDILKGKIGLADIIQKNDSGKREAEDLYRSALELAKSNDQVCDIKILESRLEDFSS